MTPGDRRLARWLLEILWFDVGDDSEDEALLRRVLDEVERRYEVQQRRGRRRRRLAAGVGAVVVLAGGATAAALYLRDQPTRPELGALCRAAPALDAAATALGPHTAPIEGCRQVWIDGEFHQPDGQIPPLTACIGPHGAIEVFPGEQGVCARLGLELAAPGLSAGNQAIVALQDRLEGEINAQDCLTVDEAAAVAEQLVSESGLDGWQVVVPPDAEAGACGKASVNAQTKTVNVFGF